MDVTQTPANSVTRGQRTADLVLLFVRSLLVAIGFGLGQRLLSTGRSSAILGRRGRSGMAGT